MMLRHVFVTVRPCAQDAGTHWYQCRLLLLSPIAVNASQEVSGVLEMKVGSGLG